MERLVQLLESKLQSKSGAEIDTAGTLQNKKIIGLYFSGHYCPPCRKFTPVLAEAYTKIRGDHDDFEIIFVSSDREEDQFKLYYEEMPWLALPYSRRGIKSSLCVLFGVKIVPTLVFLNEQGELLEAQGRRFVEDHAANPAEIRESLLSRKGTEP
uniref:Nucleoredoxin putative n=1 Tax=Albugo laibachii Nc14 TaxID=890382 RepID=F0WR47_9STRA|nr:nucleoredoxin putative [Albugo laibachii Nc14]|eukprot:CCA23807.1 nucleoredoxin putative [Albugo laibachii Nc14]